MPTLTATVEHWGSPTFADTLRDELQALGGGALPLHLGVNEGGMVDDSRLQVTVIRSSADEQTIQALVGVFFTEIVGGCSCGDEPQAKPVYCEMQVRIDRGSGDAEISVL
jgi:hypothetical protein